MNILDEIAEKTRERVRETKKIHPDPTKVLDGRPVLRRRDIPYGVSTFGPFPFEEALRKRGLSFICEVKKASPSKGLIAPHFPYVDIAADYDNAGADAISCLTEPYWFLGKNEYLTEIREATDIPILRKDFTVDDYMIYEAKAIGAQAVLLICAILDPVQLRDYKQLCDELGLSAVVEAHNADEIGMAADAGARIIGVNNRNLKDFSVDVRNAGKLRDLVPEGTIFISESGVKTREDIMAAEKMHADAVLVGETMMRSLDKSRKLMELSGRPPKVKICGMMHEEDIDTVNRLHADYAGFVFADTRHHLSDETARKLKEGLDPDIPAVGVFVDEPEEHIISLMKEGTIDIAQLHGSESNGEIRRIKKATGKKVIKAVLLKPQNAAGGDGNRTDTETLRLAETEYPDADYFLFDAGKGEGRSFEWDLLKNYRGKPFFLAGGLNPENVRQGIRKTYPFAVDVSSGVENADLMKNFEKCRNFIRNAKSALSVSEE